MLKTVTRLFDDYADATAAVSDLEALGVAHGDISIVGSNADKAHGAHGIDGHDVHDGVSKGAVTGTLVGGAGGLLAGLGMLAIPGIGPIVAAGWLITTAVGAGVGAAAAGAAGGLIAALKDAGESDEDAHVYSEGVRRGGTLVSAKVPEELVREAEATLERHRSVTAATRGEAYRASGWSAFDDKADAYSPEEIRRERGLHTGVNGQL